MITETGLLIFGITTALSLRELSLAIRARSWPCVSATVIYESPCPATFRQPAMQWLKLSYQFNGQDLTQTLMRPLPRRKWRTDKTQQRQEQWHPTPPYPIGSHIPLRVNPRKPAQSFPDPISLILPILTLIASAALFTLFLIPSFQHPLNPHFSPNGDKNPHSNSHAINILSQKIPKWG